MKTFEIFLQTRNQNVSNHWIKFRTPTQFSSMKHSLERFELENLILTPKSLKGRFDDTCSKRLAISIAFWCFLRTTQIDEHYETYFLGDLKFMTLNPIE